MPTWVVVSIYLVRDLDLSPLELILMGTAMEAAVWVNQQITDSSVRATVNSISGQADAIGQAAGGPVLGLIGNRFGTGAALGVGALLLTPALALYGRAIRHGGREPELDELPAGAAP